jgi:capsular polysaccharide biosynthesis protein
MRPTSGDDAYRRATRVYRWIVRLYPAAYRRLFGELMLQTFQDHYRDAVATGEESEARFWLGVVADEAKAIPRACLTAAQEMWRKRSFSMSAAQGREEIHIMTVFRPRLRKYWYLYLIPLLLIPIAATLYGLRRVTMYESNATISVRTNTFLRDFQAQDDTTFASKAQNVADSMTQLLQSGSFLVSVAKDTSLATMYDLSTPGGQDAAIGRFGNITVSANNTRNIVFVNTADPASPQVAQELANGIVKEFVAFYAAKELDTLTAAQDFYTKQLDDINTKVAADSKAVSEYQTQHPEVLTPVGENDPTWVQLKNQLTTDQTTQNTLQADILAVQQAMAAANSGASYDVKPLDPAPLPTSATIDVRMLLVYPIKALLAVLVLFAIMTGISYRWRLVPE